MTRSSPNRANVCWRKRFREVQRAGDAAQAFILLEDRAYRARVGAVVVALRQSGLSGPAFVRELTERMPDKPVLVLGGPAETAADYQGDHVRFIAGRAGAEELLAVVTQMAFGGHARVA